MCQTPNVMRLLLKYRSSNNTYILYKSTYYRRVSGAVGGRERKQSFFRLSVPKSNTTSIMSQFRLSL